MSSAHVTPRAKKKSRRRSLHNSSRTSLAPTTPTNSGSKSKTSRRRKSGRRSLGGSRRLSTGKNSRTPLTPLSGNDVVAKRARRKSMKKRRMSRRFSPADKVAIHASAAEITQCLKLLTQNKINEKNCFDLPLSSLLRETKDDGFERASVLLETGAAIYGKRVDNALQATHQVRESLFRTKQNTTRKVVQADAENKTASKKALVTNTLEANPDRISCKEVNQLFQVDPLFRKMSRTFDKGGAQGMLLNNLTVSNGCQVKLDSSISCHAPEASKSAFVSNESTLDIFNKIASLLPEGAHSRPACPLLASLKRLVDTAQVVAATAPTAAAMEVETDEFGGCSDDDDGGFDGGFDDDFAESDPMADGCPDSARPSTAFDADPAGSSSAARASFSVGVEKPFNLEEAIRSSSINDFAFFDPVMASRLPKPKRKARKRKASSAPRAPRSRKPKFVLDFKAKAALSVQDRTTLFSQPKSQRQTQLSKKAIKPNPMQNTIPPPLPNFEVSALSRLFLNPRLSILCRAMVGRRSAAADEVGAVASALEALDLDDADGDWDMGGGDSDDDFVVQDNRAMAFGEAPEGGDFLIAAETQVSKLDIHYETVHKRVDVRGLKADLWHSVSKQIEEPELESDAVTTPSSEVTFTDAVNAIADGMSDAVTVPVLFICVLHLANEKGLKLSNGCSDGDLSCMKNFIIEPMSTDE